VSDNKKIYKFLGCTIIRSFKMSEEPRIIPVEEIEQILLEQLAGDRILQRNIFYSLDWSISHETGTHLVIKKPDNRNPPVDLNRPKGKGGTMYHKTFRIADPEHIYFFPSVWPVNEVIEPLRSDDIVQYVPNSTLFNKPLLRVKEFGGKPEVYNPRTQQFEEWSGVYQEMWGGVYQPSLIQKLRILLGQRPKSPSIQTTSV